MKFKLTENKDLFYLINNDWVRIQLKSCFPYESKFKFLSLLDQDGKELGLIEDLENLEIKQKKLIFDYLEFKSFEFKIKGIYKVEEDFGIRTFEVKTQAGDKKFQTGLDDWPEKLEDESYLIKDLFGDLFRIESLEFGQKYLAPSID